MNHQMRAEDRNQELFRQLGAAISAIPTATTQQEPHSNKLPTLDVPKFSGDRTQWSHFKGMFRSIVHDNRRLSRIQKLQYLMSYLTGNALKLVENTPLSDHGYESAWRLLQKHFDDGFTVVHCEIERFCKIPAITTPNVSSFTTLYATTVSVLDSLDGQNATSRDPWVIYLLLSKLDSETKALWSREVSALTPTLDKFLDFLSARLKSLEMCQATPSSDYDKTTTKIASSKPVRPRLSLAAVTGESSPTPCFACQETDHRLFRCPKFLGMFPSDRLNIVRQNNLCRKCITSTHNTRDCTFFPCRKCAGPHNTLLHEAFQSSNQPTSAQRPSVAKTRSTPALAAPLTTCQTDQVNSSSQPSGPTDSTAPATSDDVNQVANVSSITAPRQFQRVFLETAVVHVFNRHGVPVQCRALLDSGAQASLISQALYQRLKLPKTLSDLYIGGVVEGGARARYQTNCAFRSLSQDANFSISCHIVPSVLQQKIPNWKVDVTQIQIPDSLVLADPTWHEPQAIDLLISNEIYNDLMTGVVRRLGPGLPVLKETMLGWVVSGPLSIPERSDSVVIVAATLSSIDKTLKRFWESEEPYVAPVLPPDHEKVEKCYRETTVRTSSGRYMVQLPLGPNLNRLGDNLGHATRQFLSLETRLNRNPDLKKQYQAAMQENFDSNFFEEVPLQEMLNPSYYLPHHCVLKTSGDSTKIRIVMNASSKSQTGISLNDVALMGPVVQPDIVTTLLRFREHPVAFICDIKKMYPQILLHPPHRDFHRILWRTDSDQPIKHYRALGVCFGVTSSPYLATRTLVDLSDQGKTSHPLASRLLKENFYVDDCLASFATVEEAKHGAAQLTDLLGSAGMSLSKWNSNSLSVIPEKQSEEERLLPEASSTLGMTWHVTADYFVYKRAPGSAPSLTKRGLLSCLASLYDPLGLITPIIVLGKLILQSLWVAGLDWDSPLPDHIVHSWTKFYNALPAVEEIQIPRCVSDYSQFFLKEVHVFADSSSYAYGAVAYAVTVSQIQPAQAMSRIMIAKSRVAPTAPTTIPQLELRAALLAAQLLHKIRESVLVSEYFLWTDSTIVLCQIRSTRLRLEPFQLSRITKIQALTDTSRWHYVPTHLNPADMVSRGMYPRELRDSDSWWNGPAFVIQDASMWPNDPSQHSALSMVITNKPTHSEPPFHPSFQEHLVSLTNNYERLLRILEYVRRFLKKPSARNRGLPSTQELQESEKSLIRSAQNDQLEEARQAIKNGALHRSQRFKHVHQLCPFIDGEGLIRVGGRLEGSTATYDTKHPILLPKCKLTYLIAMHFHRTQKHIGPQALLATLRQIYWPLGGRSLTRKVVRECITCWKQRPVVAQQRMGDLPSHRVDYSPPFSVCGVDFCGPVLTRPSFRRGGASYQTYICVFVCFVTKAVHIEVVSSLSTEAFIAALRRFSSRRGVPGHIYCDNGTNFKGACNLLEKFWMSLQEDSVLQEEVARMRTNWHFNPARSPHHGGLYEAAVKSLKHNLVREVGQTILTFEELSTVTSQIEAILNSRPISPLSEDPNELTALTPGHFLIGRPLNSIPDYELTNLSPHALTRWQLCQKVLQHFADRWRQEYLHTLQRRSKWSETHDNLGVGDIVIICEKTSSHSYPLGIIERLHPGKDGRCRVVTIRTARGTFTRAIQNISKMPIEGLPPSSSRGEHVQA
ncbi:uncharacterized protein LOC129808610 [Phlebotomus papatasi]|uniref:uncharacterized protein LOC129808610 n=1 Tax=Phlebotomus papatasi TaxID=29031 RepID=UPI002484564B|nr:uncharacterized protein LOC129808610 [Phlebotomus papatasi]